MGFTFQLFFCLVLITTTLCESYTIIDANVGAKVLPPPPPISDVAKFARYIVHYSDWGTLSHVSFQSATDGYPMAKVASISDGTSSNSSGVPYLYITRADDGIRDLVEKDNRCSMTVSLAQSNYCQIKQLDPESPHCPQVVLTGRFHIVNEGSNEFTWARRALFTRHPQMATWPVSHHFFIGKVTIEHILLVNDVGGDKYPKVSDYFKASPVPTETNSTFIVS